MTSKKVRVVLGARPKTIRRTVTAPLPEGDDCLIGIDFTYRTRSEYGQLLDDRMSAAKAADTVREAAMAATLADSGQPLPPLSSAEIQRLGLAATAAHIMDIASGWDLAEPFDLEHVTQFCDELPGVASAIVDEYRVAIIEGRRGN